MVIGEAKDVSLLQLDVDLVLLAVPGPNLATGGHRPASLVQPEVSVEVSCWSTDTCTPHSSLLDLYLKYESN